MFVLTPEIEIGGIAFKRVESVKIESSLKVLEDRATIKVPATALLKRTEDDVSEVETFKQFRVGDEVLIHLGYDGNLRQEFRGFVRKIKPQIPVVIECEDAVFLLRRKPLKKSFRNVKLKDLIQFILADTGIGIYGEVPEISFKKFEFKGVNAAKALQEIKTKYGLTMYFKEFKKLFVGLASDDDGIIVKYVIGKNVITNKLEWQEEEDVSLKIKAVLMKSDNTRIEKEVGDQDGEVRTLFFYDLENPADLAQRAKEEILKYKYSGYKGSLTTFLLPNVSVGNVADLKNEQFDEERDGRYLVDKVVTTFGQGGARREVYIGLKLN